MTYTRSIPALLMFAAATAVAHAQKPVPSHQAQPRAAAPAVVARVNDVPVRADRVTMAYEARLPAASYHRNLAADKITEIRREAFRAVIDEELQYQDAVRRKVRVPAAAVEQGLARARGGYSSPAAWDAARRKAGVSLERLRGEIRRTLMVKQAYDQAVLATCQVSAADAERFYRENPERFVMPEQRQIELITLGVDPAAPSADWSAARERARELRAKVAAGEVFADLARRYSTDPSKDRGGDLGYLHRGQMTDEIEAVVDRLRTGETSDVLETIYGVHLVRVADRRPPARRTFEEVKARLQSDLQERRCQDANEAWTASLRAAARIVVLDETLR